MKKFTVLIRKSPKPRFVPLALMFLVVALSACALPMGLFQPKLSVKSSGGNPVLVPPPPPAPMVGLAAFSANRSGGMAPLAVIFDATATTSPLSTEPFHDVLYTWTFGDPKGATWTYGARAGTVDKNTDRGPIAGHLFETAGAFTVTLDAFDGTTHRTATTVITVTDPDSVTEPYAGANTICIGQSSVPLPGDPGVPSGATLVQASTWAQVIAQVSPGKRILLRKGDAWVCSAKVDLPVGANSVPTRIGAFGTGANPQVTLSSLNVVAFSLVNPASPYEIMDIDFVGTDAVASTAINGAGAAGVVVLRCSANLVASPVKLGGNDLFIQDNDFHDMFSTNPANDWTPSVHPGSGNLGIWVADSERVAILGNRIYDATAIEHCIRTQGAGKTVYGHNFLWGPGQTKHALAIRGKVDPVNALNTIYPVLTRFVVVEDNLMDGGTNGADRLVQLGAQAGNYHEVLGDVVVEGNWLQGKFTSGIYSEVSYALTVRNNLFQSSIGSSTGLDIGYTNSTSVPVSSDTKFLNNSLYFSGTFASGSDQYSSSAQPTGLVVQNNLMYAPNATGNFHHSSAVAIYDGSIAVGTVTRATNSTDGNSGQIRLTAPGWNATPPLVLSDWTPSVIGYGQGAGSPTAVWDDFAGTPRTGAYDLGALVH